MTEDHPEFLVFVSQDHVNSTFEKALQRRSMSSEETANICITTAVADRRYS